MNYYDNDIQRAQLEAIYAQTKSNEESALGIMIVLVCVLAPAAVTTGLWWLLGFVFVWGFFAWSGFRTFLLTATALVLLKWGSGEAPTWGMWLMGAAMLNTSIAQWRMHGWNISDWWEESI